MASWTQKTDPTHFSVFAVDGKSKRPIERLPVYAEVVWVEPLPPVPPDNRFAELATRPVTEADPECGSSQECRTEVRKALASALAATLPQETRDRLLENHTSAMDVLQQVMEAAVAANGGRSLKSVAAADLQRLLEQGIRKVALSAGLALIGAGAEEPIRPVLTFPLGVLATDQVGYLSFDLARLPVAVRAALSDAIGILSKDSPDANSVRTGIWVRPLGDPMVYEALAQRRFTDAAVVMRLELEVPPVPVEIANLGILAMQNPSLSDWRLSPASFATNPSTLVGADGCESIVPANVATQESYFYQVVHLTDVTPPIAPVDPGLVQLGVVNEYRVAWNPLGHSLGRIIYSLPLAPGESVNLAVIDWTRRDDAQRQEHTTVDEQLVHDEHRDRTVTETVDAAVHEYQQGSSFLGGISQIVGAAYNKVAGAVAGSLGGSTAKSGGTREVSGTTIQKLSDNIAQVSSAKRELQSTIVVHSTQSEKEAIETRTVVNYNHSHALTILYYEVLRHYRVATEFTRQRPAVLVRFRTDWFETGDILQNIISNREALMSALLDQRLAANFDAIERVSRGPFADLTKPFPEPPQTPPDPDPPPRFHYFSFIVTTGGLSMKLEDDNQRVDFVASLLMVDGTEQMLRAADGVKGVLNPSGAFRYDHQDNFFTAVPPKGADDISWAKIRGIAFSVAVLPKGNEGLAVAFTRIRVSGVDLSGPPGTLLVDEPAGGGTFIFRHADAEQDRRLILPIKRPTPPSPPAPLFSPADIADRQECLDLIAHLKAHKGVYSRAIALAQNTHERADELDAIKMTDGSSVIQYLENRPLEVIGDYLAYPCTDLKWKERVTGLIAAENTPDPEPDERLVTLPTRGVFAEAKLGHCNASERIDPTRFWDWQKSPIPHLAPDIAAVNPVTPQPQQQNLSPTPFPNSIVNIVNPPNAPDPTGLANALKVVGTSNLFRDMSDAQQVSQMLQTLANDATSLATKLGGTASSGSGSTTPAPGSTTAPSGTTPGGGATPSGGGSNAMLSGGRATPPAISNNSQPAPTTPKTVAELNDLASGIRNQLPPDQADPLVGQLYQNAVDRTLADNATGPTDAGAIAGAPVVDLLGRFATYVDNHTLNATVGAVLNAMHDYPDTSWSYRTAHFAHAEMSKEIGPNLVGIAANTASDEVAAIKALLPPDEQALIDGNAAAMKALGTTFLFEQNGWMRAYILVNGTYLADRVMLAATVTHELTHMRNRFKFAQLETKTPTELANLFIDVAKAQTVHATNVGAGKALPVSRATMLMTEYLARLIGYCVKNEMAQPAGTISPELTTVNRLGYFRAAFEISDPVNFPSGNENSYRDNSGYYDGLTLKQKREQIALWVKQAGIYGIADYEPAWTARVTAFMADVYQAARDQVAGDGTSTPFALPTVPRDGMN